MRGGVSSDLGRAGEARTYSWMMVGRKGGKAGEGNIAAEKHELWAFGQSCGGQHKIT